MRDTAPENLGALQCQREHVQAERSGRVYLPDENRVRQEREHGFRRGAAGNRCPYRDRPIDGALLVLSRPCLSRPVNHGIARGLGKRTGDKIGAPPGKRRFVRSCVIRLK
jgi:hypothetical protein